MKIILSFLFLIMFLIYPFKTHAILMGEGTSCEGLNAASRVMTESVLEGGKCKNDIWTGVPIKTFGYNVICTPSSEGVIRYNTFLKKFEGCNGIAWTNLSGSLL